MELEGAYAIVYSLKYAFDETEATKAESETIWQTDVGSYGSQQLLRYAVSMQLRGQRIESYYAADETSVVIADRQPMTWIQMAQLYDEKFHPTSSLDVPVHDAELL